MDPYKLIGAVLALTAGLAWVNHRWLRLPPTIGVMLAGLATAGGVLALGAAGVAGADRLAAAVADMDFGDLVLKGLLGFMLFAGALHVERRWLLREKWPVAVLALGGVLLSTAVVGGLTLAVARLAGLPLGPLDALLFGALISPTDPIAVLAIIQKVGAPKDLEIEICGESLFNDGIGVVVFLTLLKLGSGQDVSAGGVALLFVREAAGALLLGAALGALAVRLMKSVDSFRIEGLITLAVAGGGYQLADAVGVSGPIAMVVAGVIVGSAETRPDARHRGVFGRLDTFWTLVDEVLNAILFVLIGLEVLTLSRRADILPPLGAVAVGAALAVPVVLLGRAVSVALPVALLRVRYRFARGAVGILIWGGLRGGLPVAMALSIPAAASTAAARGVVLAMTYAVVVFSLLVQGLTIERLVRRSTRAGRATPE